MRVGVVTTSYPRAPGDPAGSFVAEHVAWLRGAGCEVEVIAAGDGASANGGAVRIDAPRLFYGGGAPEALERGAGTRLAAAGFSLRLCAEVRARARRWDAVVAHWLAPSALAVALAARVPAVAIAHSGDVHLLARAGLADAAAALLRARRVPVVFVSDAVRARLAGACRSRRSRAWIRSMPVVPMGIDAARLARAAGDGARDGRTVVFLGRLVPIKGVDVLLDAAAALPDGARVIVAGDGPERDRLRTRAAALGDRVAFRGEVRGAERDRLLAGADVVALPSIALPDGRHEGAPLVAIEAMAAGAAVVASASGGLAELPAAAVTHVVPGDPVALARAIGALLGDSSRRARRARAGADHARTRDWSLVGPKLVEPLRIFHDVRTDLHTSRVTA